MKDRYMALTAWGKLNFWLWFMFAEFAGKVVLGRLGPQHLLDMATHAFTAAMVLLALHVVESHLHDRQERLANAERMNEENERIKREQEDEQCT